MEFFFLVMCVTSQASAEPRPLVLPQPTLLTSVKVTSPRWFSGNGLPIRVGIRRVPGISDNPVGELERRSRILLQTCHFWVGIVSRRCELAYVPVTQEVGFVSDKLPATEY
jgi:hypothetical protein